MNELFVYYQSRLVGVLKADGDGPMGFEYSKDWLSQSDSFSISLSLPLGIEPYRDGSAQRFFSNLLPEGMVRQLLTRRLGISEDNDFRLLAAIGGECAGALTILESQNPPQTSEHQYRELKGEQLNDFLRMKSALPMIDGHDGLRLSLAGAQDKLPVFVDDNRLFLPVEGAPSSHILKFPNEHFKHLPANETLMALIAEEAGLSHVKTELLTHLAKEPLCLVERYDRVKQESGSLIRLHQEDFCQALGLDSSRKYEAEGGASIVDCFELITKHSLEPLLDSRAFLDWIAFNAGVGNADGHIKNISFLYDDTGYVRLAPFYDLVCTNAYPSISRNLAMEIGGCRRAGDLSANHVERLAEDLKVGRRFLVQRFREQFERIGNATSVAAQKFRDLYGDSPAIQLTIPRIRKSIRKLLASL